MENNILQWYAIRTRSNFEQKVYDILCNKAIEAFLPRIMVMSRRKDRRKKIYVPMISGYLFAHTDLNPEEHIRILQTVGVVNIVGVKGHPVPANEDEIASLMILDGTDHTVQNRSYMKTGERVMIMEGPLKGLSGFYIRHKDKSEKVVVSIELLQRSLEVEIDGYALEKLPKL